MNDLSNNDTSPDYLNSLYKLYDATVEDLSLDSPEQMPLFSHLKSDENRYSREEVIAKGGMKEILKVYDEKTGRQVAMARLHPNSPEELFEPFLREAQLTALLDHPNIINIYDIGLDENNQPYFTMELKNGKGLDKLLPKPQQLSPHQQVNHLLEIFIKVCDAVSYAHSQGVLHLDLKPENIQVGKYGEVIVCDWGLGKIIDSIENDVEFDQLLLNPDLLNNMTLAGEIRGTPGFMAPEQVQKAGNKTPQTDVYALGAILFSIISGQPIINGDTQTVINKTLSGDFEVQLPNGTAQSLKAIISKAIALQPEDRYKSVTRLRSDVYNYLSGYPTEAENASVVTQLKLFYGRNKTLCLLTFTFIFISIIATGLFIQNLNKIRATAEAAQRQAEHERHVAENNLELYLKGQKRINSMSNFRSNELLKEGKIYRSSLFFEDPVKFLKAALNKADKAIKINNNIEAYSEKGHLLFIKQDFAGALNALKINSSKNQDLLETCRQLLNIPKTEEGLLPIPTLAELVKKPKFRINSYERLLAYDLQKRTPDSSYGIVMENFLKLINDGTDLNLSYEPHRQTISLRSLSPIRLISDKEWSSEKSILRLLKVERLEIRGKSIIDLHQLRGMNTLKEVDLRNSFIKNLKPLNKIPSMSRLIVNIGQFSKTELSVLSRRILIKER